MPKVISWTTDQWKDQLVKRKDDAKRYREIFENQWQSNKAIIHNDRGDSRSSFNLTFDNLAELQGDEVTGGDSDIGMNYAFKYLRFFHSQLSANPPSVVVRPTSTDPMDKRKADAADRLVRYGMRDKDLPEVIDQASFKMLVTGTGWVKIVWDPDLGDIYDFNEETQEVTMEGDIRCYSPDTEDVWIDPDAKRWEDVRYVIERIVMPLDEAIFHFPEHKKQLLENATNNVSIKDSLVSEPETIYGGENKVIVYEYYEKGLPLNGMAGRFARFLEDGTIIGTPGKNPHYQAQLPYHIFTYLDVPRQVYAKSTVEYVARLQSMLNRLDSTILDNIQAHGTVRFAIHETTEIEDEAISNSAWDYIKYSGSQPPHFISPPALMNDIWQFRSQLVQAIQDIYGINDSMLGIQRREQSAISQQTAIESGTMVHRRVFKKYQSFVEQIYKAYLGLIKENWEEPRTVLVLGKEKAFEAADIKGADIAGGFDIVVEYGASLPIDPNMRREAIMLLMEPLKEAGMSMKAILKLMKLNDLEGMHDRMELAEERQREIFETMVAKFREGDPIYIAPEDLQEHQGMLEYAYDYVMTSEFNHQLEPELKELIKRHIREREQMAAQKAAPAPAAGAVPAGMPGVGGAQQPTMGGAPDLATILGG